MRTFTLIVLTAAMLASPAYADDPIASAGDIERAFGMGWESFDSLTDPSACRVRHIRQRTHHGRPGRAARPGGIEIAF